MSRTIASQLQHAVLQSKAFGHSKHDDRALKESRYKTYSNKSMKSRIDLFEYVLYLLSFNARSSYLLCPNALLCRTACCSCEAIVLLMVSPPLPVRSLSRESLSAP